MSSLAFLALAAAPQPTQEHTIWTLGSLSLGAETITPGRTMTLPRRQIAGGRVTGSAGCSPLKASVRVRGQALLLRTLDAGRNDFCPDHALSLREDFMTLLGRATRSTVQDGQLTLYARRGGLTSRAT